MTFVTLSEMSLSCNTKKSAKPKIVVFGKKILIAGPAIAAPAIAMQMNCLFGYSARLAVKNSTLEQREKLNVVGGRPA